MRKKFILHIYVDGDHLTGLPAPVHVLVCMCVSFSKWIAATAADPFSRSRGTAAHTKTHTNARTRTNTHTFAAISRFVIVLVSNTRRQNNYHEYAVNGCVCVCVCWRECFRAVRILSNANFFFFAFTCQRPRRSFSNLLAFKRYVRQKPSHHRYIEDN